MFSDGNVKQYAKALYPLTALLMLVPLVDIALRTFPPQFGALQWRFATVGLVFGNLGTILLGFGLAGLIATISEHRRALRVLGIIALVLAVLFIALLALFALDAVQIRRLATTLQLKRAILVSSLGALITGSFGVLVLASIGRGALVASRLPTRASTAPRRSSSPLVVAGSPGTTEAV